MNLDYLDSLLLSGNFQVFLDYWDTTSIELNKNDYESIIKNCYQELYDRIIEINTLSEEVTYNFCEGLRKTYLQGNKPNKNEKAIIEYQRFLNETENRQYLEAMKHYYTAVCFSDRDILSEKARLRNNYSLTVKLYQNKKYDDALYQIELFKEEDLTNIAYKILGDSLSFLYFYLQKNILKDKTSLKLQEEQKSYKKRFALSIEPDYIIWQQKELMLLHRTFSDYAHPIIVDSYRLSFLIKFHFEYYFNKSFSIGMRGSGGKICDFKSPLLDGEVHVYESFYSSGLTGSYFPAKKMAKLRPYICFETGFINMKRNRIILASSDFWGVEYVPIKRYNKTLPQIITEFGFNLDLGIINTYYLGIHSFLLHTFGDNKIANNSNIGGGIRIGVNLF